jgi:toxin secretion/phage lysis holin
MTENTSKGIIGSCIGVMSYLYGCISEIIIILVIFMIFDYITGVVVALKERKFCKSVGAWGVVKKVMYIILIVIGFLADFSAAYLIQKIGIKFSTNGALGLCVVLYLIGNEGLSLTKNLIALGLPAPPFLTKSFGLMKSTAENISKE